MEAISHFANLARRGRHPGASGGETRAYQLAAAVIENVPGLDHSAKLGLVEFLVLAGNEPEVAREMLNGPAD